MFFSIPCVYLLLYLFLIILLVYFSIYRYDLPLKEFIFKPFEEMTEEDYATVGFKSGLEIHQQLLTEKKTFLPLPRREIW